MEVAEINKVLAMATDFKKPEVLTEVRKQAMNALSGIDFPTTRVEEWKYTRVAKYTNRKYKQIEAEVDVKPYRIENLDAHQLVFINGFYDEKQSIIFDDDALSIQNIDELDDTYYSKIVDDTQENAFSLINKAYQTGGVFITVKKDKKLKYPLHLIHVLSEQEVITNTRHFIQMEMGAKAEIITSFHSENSDKSFSNVVMEGDIAENATLVIHKIQSENNDVFHISNELFIQEKSSTFTINTVTTGGEMVRNGLIVLVEGENCHTELNGIYLGIDKQQISNQTVIDQLYAHCTSDELYKGVLDDHAVGSFDGRIIVRPDAQKIASYQSNKNILNSKTATANSKPSLEIYADDVRCSHGSTIGELDEDAIFYLQTRGLSKEKAKHLLTAAFIGEVLEKIENKPVRAYLDNLFLKDFGWEF